MSKWELPLVRAPVPAMGTPQAFSIAVTKYQRPEKLYWLLNRKTTTTTNITVLPARW